MPTGNVAVSVLRVPVNVVLSFTYCSAAVSSAGKSTSRMIESSICRVTKSSFEMMDSICTVVFTGSGLPPPLVMVMAYTSTRLA